MTLAQGLDVEEGENFLRLEELERRDVACVLFNLGAVSLIGTGASGNIR